MVQLFLSEPNWNDNQDDGSVKDRISLLNELGSVLWSLMTAAGRSEARLWLCNTVAGITSITPRHRSQLFMSLLRSRPLKRGLASRLVRMIIEKCPCKLGRVLAVRSRVFEKFFQGNPRRILHWFSTSVRSGGLELGKGIKALTKFAFVNRDICWEELEWKGKHGQSPAMVATKPHYFLDLDIQQTVENFVQYVPEFWSSKEFSESLMDGDILYTDTNFFVELFVGLMYKEDSADVWEVVDKFLSEESFSSLCQHLLITLEEQDFCIFLGLLCKFVKPKMELEDFGNISCWLEIILSQGVTFESIDELLLLNGVINQGRQILRLVHDEEFEDEGMKVRDIVLKICSMSTDSNSLAPLFRECLKMKAINAIKWLGLQSWVQYYLMSEECRDAEYWESLFMKNKIDFQRDDKSAILNKDGLSSNTDSDVNDMASTSKRRKKKEKRRKKRKVSYHDDDYDHELLDFGYLVKTGHSSSDSASWFLSTDAYSTKWNSVDLPEHLSKHCFSIWTKWIFSK